MYEPAAIGVLLALAAAAAASHKEARITSLIISDVRIELYTARVLCRAFYRVLGYSTDTGSGYKVAQNKQIIWFFVQVCNNNGLK